VPQLTVSPDGRHLVFVAGRPQQKPSLWLRTLSEREPRELPDTVDADVPFWSPDSRTIAFFSHGILKKRDIAGTAPSQFAGKATVDVRGGAWSQTGTIVFAPAGNIGLFKLAGAGAAERLNLQDAAGPFYTARWPEFVPGHDQFVFQLRDPADVARKGLYLGADSTSPSHAASWTGTLPRSTRRT
jgi:dipeptidyl aminopeptidase/acylaminoacyl peptidase